MFAQLQSNFAYAKYITKHRWFVFVECVKLGIPIRGLTHDLSKFRPDEWVPYREFFYGKKNKEGYFHKAGTDEAFDGAWLKHIHRNPHHWQYWLLREDDGDTKALEMPMKYLLEMVADWRGAGKAQGFDSITDWFAKNNDKITLHPVTRDQLEIILRQKGELD